jgi:hypothetical protein
MFLLVAAFAVAGLADDKKKNTTDATLLNGRLHFSPPEDEEVWQKARNVDSDDAAAYARHDHQGAIAIQVLPPDAEMTDQMGGAVIRSLRDAHKKANQKILYGPKVEPDNRFALKVHEKYQSGDKVADELHIYRDVGPRVIMVTVNAWVTDEVEAQQIHKAGEDLAFSARWSAALKK